MRCVMIAIGFVGVLTFVMQASRAEVLLPPRQPNLECRFRLSERDPVTGAAKLVGQDTWKFGPKDGCTFAFSDHKLALRIWLNGIVEERSRHTVAQFVQLNLKLSEETGLAADPLSDENWNPAVVSTPANYRVGLGMPTRLTMIVPKKKCEYIVEVRVTKLK
jgi:hypothetical protein